MVSCISNAKLSFPLRHFVPLCLLLYIRLCCTLQGSKSVFIQTHLVHFKQTLVHSSSDQFVQEEAWCCRVWMTGAYYTSSRLLISYLKLKATLAVPSITRLNLEAKFWLWSCIM